MGSRPRVHGGRLFAGECRVSRAPTRDAPTEMAEVGARMKDGFPPSRENGWGALGLRGRAVLEPPLRRCRGEGGGGMTVAGGLDEVG